MKKKNNLEQTTITTKAINQLSILTISLREGCLHLTLKLLLPKKHLWKYIETNFKPGVDGFYFQSRNFLLPAARLM